MNKLVRWEQLCLRQLLGLYNKVEDAMQAMGSGFDAEYIPIKENVAVYAKRYKKYLELGEKNEQLTVNN